MFFNYAGNDMFKFLLGLYNKFPESIYQLTSLFLLERAMQVINYVGKLMLVILP